jgi:hypothetical protein
MATTATATTTTWLVDDDTYALRTAKGAVDRAADDYEQARQKLYRQDGTPKYAPAELQERTAALLAPVKAAVDDAKATATRVQENANRTALVEHADPLLSIIEPEERAEVGYKSPLVAADCAQLSLPQLAQQLEAVLAHGSRIEQLLYLRHAAARADAARRQAANSPQPVDGLGPVLRRVDELRTATRDPQVQKALDKAAALRNQAMDLTIHAGQRLRTLDGTLAVQQRAAARRYR